MSSVTQPLAVPRPGALAVMRDYAELVKARVTTLIIMTAWCGYYFGAWKAEVSSLSWTLLHALLGIGLVSGGTAALNEVMEHDLDALMRRTSIRPIPCKRMSVTHGAVVGTLMVLGGTIYLALAANLLTGLLTLATSVVYLAVYTPLKKHSTLCTFVGAFPGAMPPLLGWTAVRGRLDWGAVALFAIVFLWQFPHFHSIAWLYREDYQRAGIQMLPAVESDGRATARQIVLYSLVLIPASLAPTFLGMSGRTYLAGAIALGLAFFWTGARLAKLRLAPATAQSKARARQVLQASVFYLPLLFALMMINSAAS